MVLVEHYLINGILMVLQKLIELKQSRLTRLQILQLLLVMHFQMIGIFLFQLQQLILKLKLLEQGVVMVLMILEAPVEEVKMVEVVDLVYKQINFKVKL